MALEQALTRISARLGGATVEAGFFSDVTYPDGTPVKLVAAYNEFGDPLQNRPARPFMRMASDENAFKWQSELERIAANGATSEEALNAVGRMMVADIQKMILTGKYAPLHPRTIRKKGHDQPLIDTRLMLNSVEYRVTREQPMPGQQAASSESGGETVWGRISSFFGSLASRIGGWFK